MEALWDEISEEKDMNKVSANGWAVPRGLVGRVLHDVIANFGHLLKS